MPHTEVDLVLVNGESVSFKRKILDGDRVSVYPVFESVDVSSVSAVRARPLRDPRFIVDVHMGKLAGYLRLCGFDTLYRNDWEDQSLAETAAREGRILLTQDRALLKRAVVTHGHMVRATIPRAQVEEILERFDLWALIRPLSRCSLCNGPIAAVAKADVVARLPERTVRHFDEFWCCTVCEQLYWQGAHYRSLSRLFRRGVHGGGGEAPAGEERYPD